MLEIQTNSGHREIFFTNEKAGLPRGPALSLR